MKKRVFGDSFFHCEHLSDAEKGDGDIIEEKDFQLIIPLKGAERIRKRSVLCFGADGAEGCKTALKWLLEFLNRESGKMPYLEKTSDGVYRITCECEKALIPKIKNAFLKTRYAGPKFAKTQEIDELEKAMKVYGARCASKNMTVNLFDGQVCCSLEFKKGELKGNEKKAFSTDGLSGVEIFWLPDEVVFGEAMISSNELFEMMAIISH